MTCTAKWFWLVTPLVNTIVPFVAVKCRPLIRTVGRHEVHGGDRVSQSGADDVDDRAAIRFVHGIRCFRELESSRAINNQGRFCGERRPGAVGLNRRRLKVRGTFEGRIIVDNRHC